MAKGLVSQSDRRKAQEVKSFVSDFFTYYFTERSCDKAAAALAQRVVFVGLSNDEIAYDRAGCIKIMGAQMRSVSKPIPYFVEDYYQQERGDGGWDCFARVDLNVVSTVLGTSRYDIRITMTVRSLNEGYELTAVHVSEAGGFSGTRFGRRSDGARMTAQKELGRIMSQVVPGGIVSRYVSQGSPISIVNDEYLRMLHHATFYDLMEDCGGLFENNVHPADLDGYRNTVQDILTTGNQCACEYRIRRSNGSYMWVHDTGRRAVSTDGRDLIVSILTDMSGQIERRREMEREIETDALTSVYNRRGAVNHFVDLEKRYGSYALLVIDVDNFKLINDLYGHKQGDRSLVYVAEMLSEAFGETGIVCRLGGDEFGVFVPDYGSLEDLRDMLERIITGVKAHGESACPRANTSISVGGVYGTGCMNPEAAFEAADANLYRIKKHSKNGLCLTEMSEA